MKNRKFVYTIWCICIGWNPSSLKLDKKGVVCSACVQWCGGVNWTRIDCCGHWISFHWGRIAIKTQQFENNSRKGGLRYFWIESLVGKSECEKGVTASIYYGSMMMASKPLPSLPASLFSVDELSTFTQHQVQQRFPNPLSRIQRPTLDALHKDFKSLRYYIFICKYIRMFVFTPFYVFTMNRNICDGRDLNFWTSTLVLIDIQYILVVFMVKL